jgi:hypothetical protein
MADSILVSDPWETPPLPLDPDLVANSQKLMSCLDPETSASGNAPSAPNQQELKIQQLETEKQQLFERNVNLRAEVVQLRVRNQQLIEENLKLQQRQSPTSWWARWFRSS